MLLLLCGGLLAVPLGVLMLMHARPRPFVQLMGRYLPQVVFSVPTHSKVVALTIDDAPHPAVTPKILEALQALGVKATFFVIGSQAEQWPQLLLDIASQGHEVGNHLMEDEAAYKLTPEQFETQLLRVDGLLQPHFGLTRWFRPGHGWIRRWMFPILERHGYRTALGSIFGHDPAIHNRRMVGGMLKTQAFPGGIIVIHDGGPQRLKTVDILNDVVPDLLRRGYTLVTLSDLVAMAEPSAPPTLGTSSSQQTPT